MTWSRARSGGRGATPGVRDRGQCGRSGRSRPRDAVRETDRHVRAGVLGEAAGACGLRTACETSLTSGARVSHLGTRPPVLRFCPAGAHIAATALKVEGAGRVVPGRRPRGPDLVGSTRCTTPWRRRPWPATWDLDSVSGRARAARLMPGRPSGSPKGATGLPRPGQEPRGSALAAALRPGGRPADAPVPERPARRQHRRGRPGRRFEMLAGERVGGRPRARRWRLSRMPASPSPRPRSESTAAPGRPSRRSRRPA